MHACDCVCYECVQLTVVTSDKRKMQLVFKAHVIEMGENVLVDFRLSRVSVYLLQEIAVCFLGAFLFQLLCYKYV